MTCASCQTPRPPSRDRLCSECRRVWEARVRLARIVRARQSFAAIGAQGTEWLAMPHPDAVWTSTSMVLRALCGDESGRPA